MGILPERPAAVQGAERSSRAKKSTCATISPALKCRSKPICPVAQNVQPKAQPACVETQTVARGLLSPCGGYSISTDSISLPSASSSRILRVVVFGVQFTAHNHWPDSSLFRQLLAQCLGQVGHGREIGCELLIQPAMDLF